jgi:trimethylamine---corrinoid protein Co-methyltransferase
LIHGMRAGLRHSGTTLNLFSEADCDDLHMATLDVLARAGVLVDDDAALDIFADGGCKVDRETHVVKIPAEIVAKALTTAPPQFVLAGRDPKKDVLIAQGRVTVCPFTEGVMVNDMDTGGNRHSTMRDLQENLRVGDYCKNYDFNTVSVTARDAPPETAELHHMEAALTHNTKSFMVSCTSTAMAEAGYEIGCIVAGGEDKFRERPLFTYGYCPVGPMYLTEICTSVTISCARLGIPACCISMDMAGANSPITLAGTLIVQNAELLSCLVLSQAVQPGAAFYYGTSTDCFDMRRGSATVGTAELALVQAGTQMMARYYNLPSWTAGY